MAYLLSIDLGTTGCRSMVFDERLRLLGSCYEEYGLLAPRPDWYEQDAQLWWDLSLRTLAGAMAQSGVDKREVRAISVSSQGIAVVPTDENFTPLRTALSWMDVRAREEEAQLATDMGQRESFTRTGKRIDAAYTLPKLLWMQKNEPEIWRAASWFLMPLDYLTAKLTGKAVTDPSMASGTLLYDIKNECWHLPTLEQYAIASHKLAEIRPCGSVAGTLLPAVSKRLGLPESCVVAVGAQDQRCAALGAGLDGGTVTVSLGTAAAICKLQTVCKTEGSMQIGWSPYVHPGTWVTEGVVATAGAGLRWLRDTFFTGASYDTINQEARAAWEKESPVLFLPYLNGPGCPRFDKAATGCFHGVTLASGRGDFALAVMQGVALQTREILEAMGAMQETGKLVLFGGGANSALWCQLFADAMNLPVLVPESAEAAGLGAAMLAGVGAGLYALDGLPHLKVATTYTPSPRASWANAQYERFRQLELRLAQNGDETP